MPVEIREIVLQARVIGDDAPGPRGRPADGKTTGQSQERLRDEILTACEQMIRDALDRRAAR